MESHKATVGGRGRREVAAARKWGDYSPIDRRVQIPWMCAPVEIVGIEVAENQLTLSRWAVIVG
jgi:hypothetical protein